MLIILFLFTHQFHRFNVMHSKDGAPLTLFCFISPAKATFMAWLIWHSMRAWLLLVYFVYFSSADSLDLLDTYLHFIQNVSLFNPKKVIQWTDRFTVVHALRLSHANWIFSLKMCHMVHGNTQTPLLPFPSIMLIGSIMGRVLGGKRCYFAQGNSNSKQLRVLVRHLACEFMNSNTFQAHMDSWRNLKSLTIKCIAILI